MRIVLTHSIIVLALMSAKVMAEATLDLKAQAEQHNVKLSVLQDFVQSHDFKCPEPLNKQQLEQQLASLDEDSDLAIMLEADRMDWRDLYVESRSQIQCMTGEEVSKGY